MSLSTPADGKNFRRGKTVGPLGAREEQVELKAANSIVAASERIMDAAEIIVNCMNELKPTLSSLANRNHREIVNSAYAVKQLVSNLLIPGFY